MRIYSVGILRNFINRYKVKQELNKFIQSKCSVALTDCINNLQRPKNKKVRILGNGDSLNESLKDLNNDVDYFVVSRHVIHPSFFLLKPKYYIIADPKWWTLEDGKCVTQSIFQKTTWPMILFVPWGANMDFVPKSNFVKIQYVNSYPYFGDSSNRDYLYDHNLSMPVLQNVIVGAIYCSIYLGYSEIELYGVEHSWTKALRVNDRNEVCILDTHFYDKEKIKEIPFTEYDKNKSSWKFHEVLQAYARMFQSYWDLKEIAERKRVSITNCTPGSFIDAFQRKKNA